MECRVCATFRWEDWDLSFRRDSRRIVPSACGQLDFRLRLRYRIARRREWMGSREPTYEQQSVGMEAETRGITPGRGIKTTHQFPSEITSSMLSLCSLQISRICSTSAKAALAEIIQASASLMFRDFSLPEWRRTVFIAWNAKSYIENSISLSSFDPMFSGVFRNYGMSQFMSLCAKDEKILPPALIATSYPSCLVYQWQPYWHPENLSWRLNASL